MTKADLIARLEKEGGSRELDAEICALRYQMLHPETEKHYSRAEGEAFVIYFRDPQGRLLHSTHMSFPKYTTSLDAAIALCKRVLPPNWQMEIFMSMSGPTAVALTDVDVSRYPGTVKKLDEIEHKSPATALCIALLRALEDGK